MHRIILSRILIVILIMAAPSFASDWEEDAPKNGQSTQGKTEAAPAGGILLRGKVEHSQKLPALSNTLQAGENFDPKNLGNAKYESKWLKIPAWFAGTFATEQSTITLMQDYATGRKSTPNKTISSQGSEHFGFQKDRDGDIWHFYVETGTSKSIQAQHATFNTIDWYGPELMSTNRIVIRILATSLIVDRSTGTIVDSYRREDFKSYEPMNNGALRVSYTSKSFDSHGRPRDLQEGYSIYTQIAPFSVIDQSEGNNYREMFKQFLNSHNMANLVPR